MVSAEKKHAILIGASSGIGREMALRLADAGWRVGITGRRRELLDALRLEHPSAFEMSCFDITDSAALAGNLQGLAARLGGLDLLVISSGTGHLNPMLDAGLESATVAVNVHAFTLAADWGYAYFRQAGKGQLAAITSVGGLIAEAAAPAYSASKAYQILYLAGLRKRAAKELPGLTITELRPGSVDTAMMKGEGHFWISQPAAAAALACKAIAGRKKLQYISRRWRVIGLLLRLFALFS